MPALSCRCGFDGQGDHPCHAKAYGCRQPARERFYSTGYAALPGAQVKLSASQTWACDECWEEFKKILKLRTGV